jgi:hypothetical protein
MKNTISISFTGALFILFLGLRLTDNINWEWYWVAAPLWVPLTIALVVAMLGTLVYVIGTLGRGKKPR